MDHIIFFDGSCNLCNASVKFTIKHDRNGIFRSIPFQSETAEKYLPHAPDDPDQLSRVLYFSSGKRYEKSSAVLHILKDLGGIWKLMYAFIMVPPFMRDFLYNIIAKNRFIFGRKSWYTAPVPRD